MIKILVVDDEEHILMILKESLEHEKVQLGNYHALLEMVQGESVFLEEYARKMITDEQMHISEVEKMLSDSFEFAESDFNARFLAEARVEGESLVRAAKRSLEKGSHLIEAKEKIKIEKLIADLEARLKEEDFKVIKKAIESLNEGTKHLAELIMDEAVSIALKGKSI